MNRPSSIPAWRYALLILLTPLAMHAATETPCQTGDEPRPAETPAARIQASAPEVCETITDPEPILHQISLTAEQGLQEAIDSFVAFSPERFEHHLSGVSPLRLPQTRPFLAMR